MNTELRPNERRVAMHRNGLVTFVLLCGLLLSACTPAAPTPTQWPVWEDERIIPFQTIDVDNDSRSLLPEAAGVPEIEEKFDPGILLPEEAVPTVSQLYKIESVEDIEPLVGLLPTATIDHLRNMDYNAYMVFALLRGKRGEGSRETFIERISISEDFNVYAQFRVPAVGSAVTQGESFPYHVVKVRLADMFPAASGRPSFTAINLLARLCDDDKHPC